jgi:hypothetical protein
MDKTMRLRAISKPTLPGGLLVFDYVKFVPAVFAGRLAGLPLD